MWFPGRIPRASFILWLAVFKKLGTRDRVYITTQNAQCYLCHSQQESHEHLFFECPMSMHIWSSISQRGVFQVPTSVWDNLINWISLVGKGIHLVWELENSILLQPYTTYGGKDIAGFMQIDPKETRISPLLSLSKLSWRHQPRKKSRIMLPTGAFKPIGASSNAFLRANKDWGV